MATYVWVRPHLFFMGIGSLPPTNFCYLLFPSILHLIICFHCRPFQMIRSKDDQSNDLFHQTYPTSPTISTWSLEILRQFLVHIYWTSNVFMLIKKKKHEVRNKKVMEKKGYRIASPNYFWKLSQWHFDIKKEQFKDWRVIPGKALTCFVCG